MTLAIRVPLPEIHTSGRNLFKDCRRRWYFQDPLRRNLAPAGEARAPLWFGTGFHFAMEDFHGLKRFPSLMAAFQAFVKATDKEDLPDTWEEHVVLARGMFDYYEFWRANRENQFQTLWLGSRPQVEVNFKVKIPGVRAVYAGTFDWIVKDIYGRLWIADYKTARSIDRGRTEIDSQISAYTWAAQQIYGQQFEGVIFMQFLKKAAAEPDSLKNGEFSLNKAQATTRAIYQRALINRFGSVPPRYVDFLNMLAGQETPEGDAFIRMDLVRRNEAAIENEAWMIQAEAKDMINPKLPMYTHPTTMGCSQCDFRSPCLSMNDGSDWESMLEGNYSVKKEMHPWRAKIEYPEPLSYEAGLPKARKSTGTRKTKVALPKSTVDEELTRITLQYGGFKHGIP